MFLVAIERGGKMKNMIKDCSGAKQQLTGWVEKMKEGKVKEFSSSLPSFFGSDISTWRKGRAFGGF